MTVINVDAVMMGFSLFGEEKKSIMGLLSVPNRHFFYESSKNVQPGNNKYLCYIELS